MSSILLIFIDGIGVGQNDPKINPFAQSNSSFFPLFDHIEKSSLPFDGLAKPINVDMGIAGLPQSATGQTAMLTGINASQEMQRHVAGFPTPTLRKIIDEHSLYKKLKAIGKTGCFANALSKEYFKRLGERISTTTRSLIAGDFKPLMMEDLQNRNALTHDLTNKFLIERGVNVPEFTIADSAQILAELSKKHDFTLFEYIISDKAGHAQDFAKAQHIIADISEFLGFLLVGVDLKSTTVLLTSDHGNMEDLSVKTHTNNRVPFHIWGKWTQHLANSVQKIEEITPAILATFE